MEIFDIIYTIDGDGTFLYVENNETLETLERLFETNHNKNVRHVGAVAVGCRRV